MLEWPAVEFLCRRKLRVTPASAGMTEYNSSLRVQPIRLSLRRWMPAFASMTAGMTRWARLLQQARPSIETQSKMLIAVTSERW